MCGIAGFIDPAVAPSEQVPSLLRMMAAIRHRGPDEAGCYLGDGLGVGSVRLAIIDLQGGHQPFLSEDDRFVLVYNGEVFNYLELRQQLRELGHRFRTESDTEVVLRSLLHWGEDAIARFNGQFAFTMIDTVEQSILAARDRFGERPYFYHHQGGRFVFASEIKALLEYSQISPRLASDAIRRAFRLWTTLPSETCFEGIAKLEPGHMLHFRDGRATVVPYYRLPVGSEITTLSEDEASVEVRRRLEESVRIRLRSDVPVGVYLSGGLDSTIVAALARGLKGDSLKSYAVEFEEPDYDESAYQDEAVKCLGTDHSSIRIGARDIVDVFPEVVRHTETVLFRSAPAPMYLLSKAVNSDGLKVVLTGEGADEGFLGYDIFKETLSRLRYSEFEDDAERSEQLRQLYPYLKGFQDGNTAGMLRFFSSYASGGDDALFSHATRFALGQFAERLLTKTSEKTPEDELQAQIEVLFPELQHCSALMRCQILEYWTLLDGYLLSSQGDRMSAAHSVEGRCPFLDPEVVDLAFRLPDDHKLRCGTSEKHVLKAAFSDLLPERIAKRYKQPYRAPDSRSFLRFLGQGWLGELLSEDRIAQCGILDAPRVVQFLGRLAAKPSDAISPREDQAFMLIASFLLLDEVFVRARARPGALSRTDCIVFEDRRSVA